MRRLATRDTTKSGSALSGAPAMIGPYDSELYALRSSASATGSGNMSGLFTAINGHRKSFHAERKAKMPSAASTGCDSGSTIRVNTCQALAPSIRAASSSSPGIVRSEEHTSELQSLAYLVCRLLLEKKKKTTLASHTAPVSR